MKDKELRKELYHRGVLHHPDTSASYQQTATPLQGQVGNLIERLDAIADYLDLEFYVQSKSLIAKKRRRR